MKVIAIANNKGGVAKTSTALNIADSLKHLNYKVLLIDLDSQCNSTTTYRAKIDDTYTIYDVMEKECEPQDAIQKTEMGDIIAGDSKLEEVEMKYTSQIGGYNLIKNAVHKLDGLYDYIIIDTPGSLGIYLLNALTAATGVVIPVKAEIYSIDGLSSLLNVINQVIQNTNPELRIYGVLLTSYDKRNTLDNRILKELPQTGEAVGFHVFKNPIRVSQSVKDSQGYKISLLDNYGKTNAAEDYKSLVNELLSIM